MPLRSGSGSTVVEVVVLATVVEVVVHDDDSGTIVVELGRSGTCFIEELDAHGVDGRGTHVVGVLVGPVLV